MQSAQGNIDKAVEPPRILVIEDEAFTRRAMGLILQLDGYDVTLAEHGDEAMAVFDSVLPDLVVMDWRMPGLEGNELLRAIRHRNRTVPIIIVSGAAEAFRFEEPADALFPKPVDAHRLRTEVAAQLAFRAPGSSTPRRPVADPTAPRQTRRLKR